MSNHQPLIDSNPQKKNRDWRRDTILGIRPFFVAGIAFFIMAVAIILSFGKSCTDLGSVAKEDTYAYEGKDGFVGKTNELLVELLGDTLPGTKVIDLKSLSRRYPALEFALPYSESSHPVIEAADLRLVGIHPERIKKSRLKDFYFNSRLPQLFQQQSEHMGDNYFRIKVKALDSEKDENGTETRAIIITDISLNPAMFRVALAKNPWKGTIRGNANCLFNEDSTVYVSFCNSMLPIPVSSRQFSNGNVTYTADADHDCLTTTSGKPIDYYDHYKAAFDPARADRSRHVTFSVASGGKVRGHFGFDCKGDSMRVVASGVCVCVYREKEPMKTVRPSSGENSGVIVKRVDGMKLIVYDEAQQRKYGEFTITEHDPTRCLSQLVQTQTGANRYNVGPSQTDLFTQQLVRGLTRHLTNRTGVNNVDITLDPLLSREFEAEVRDYLTEVRTSSTFKRIDSQKKERFDISMTVMDMYTGNILAAPFYTTEFEPAKTCKEPMPIEMRLSTRNVALSRRYLGSTFKPILACAAVQANPSLLDLKMTGQCKLLEHSGTKGTAEFFGYRTAAWAFSHWGTGMDFENFLRVSHDVYPVALASIALTGSNYSGMNGGNLPINPQDDNNAFAVGGGTNKPLLMKNGFSADTHPFINWVSRFSGANADNELSPYECLFRNLNLQDVKDEDERRFGIEEVSPDVTDLRFSSIFDGGGLRGSLVPWVLGQGNNEWNTIQIATAWARMLTGYNIEPTYVLGKEEKDYSLFGSIPTRKDSTQSSPVPGCNTNGLQPRSAEACRATWVRFLDYFKNAQSGSSGTLHFMAEQVNRLNSAYNLTGDNQLQLYSKTGTPSAYSRYEQAVMGGNDRYFDIGLYTFGLMTSSEAAAARQGKKPHGIVCVIRLTRSYQCANCDAARAKGSVCCSACGSQGASGLWSDDARNFFSKEAAMPRFKKFYEMTRNYY